MHVVTPTVPGQWRRCSLRRRPSCPCELAKSYTEILCNSFEKVLAANANKPIGQFKWTEFNLSHCPKSRIAGCPRFAKLTRDHHQRFGRCHFPLDSLCLCVSVVSSWAKGPDYHGHSCTNTSRFGVSLVCATFILAGISVAAIPECDESAVWVRSDK
jgi:hypothetical protein